MSLPPSAPSANTRALRHCSSCTCPTTSTDTPIEPDRPISVASLDLEIARMEEVVAQNIRSLALLKRQRNEGLPVSRVPPEVLGDVFLYFRGDSMTDSESYTKRISWISIIHVSSHWRTVAFTTPYLWNTLNLHFPQLVELFVAHCGALPLSIMLPIGKSGRGRDSRATPRISAGAKALRSVNNPIADVRLHGTYHDVVPCLQHVLPHASQDVRVLILSLEEREWDPIDILDKASLPQLQTISLTVVGLSSDSVLLQGCAGSLRELKLVDCIMHTGIGVLGLLSGLETLYIDRLSPVENEVDIVLPVLKVLTLKDNVSRCTVLLKCLKITSSCRVTIFPGGATNASRESFSEMLTCISGWPQSPSRLVVHFSEKILTIQRGHHTIILVSTRYWNAVNSVLDIANAILAPVTTALALSWEDSELTQDGLLRLVRDTSITELDIGGHGAFLDALARCVDLHDEFLPGLAQLRISDADFTKLPEEVEQCWNHGVASRRGVLMDIRTVGCIGVPPPVLLSGSTP